MLLGDGVVQRAIEGRDSMDWKRTRAMVTFGLYYNGAITVVAAQRF